MFLYNIPQLTKTMFGADTLRRLMSIPQIIGLKDSAGDFEVFQELLRVCRERADWSVLIGPEHLLCAATQLGGDGGINGGANIFPRLFVDAYEAALRGDAVLMEERQQQIIQLGRLYRISRRSTGGILGVKGALSVLGVCDHAMTAPFGELTEAERVEVRDLLVESGLLQFNGEAPHFLRRAEHGCRV
jgi:4-hydroxy-tetrahydrodipicolinate synthase